MPAAMIVLAATLWGLIGPAAVLAEATGMPALAMAFWRAAIAALLFALMAGRRLFRLRAGDLAGTALFGITGIAIMYGAFFQSVTHNGAPLAAILLYTGPVWVALIQSVRLRRLPGRMTMLALALAVSGVIVVSWTPDVTGDDVGILWGLLSGLAFATHFTLAPDYIERLGAAPVYAVAMLTASVLLVPVTGMAVPPAAAWPYLLYVAVGATFAASYAFAAGIVRIEPTRAAVLATVEPVVAALASIIFLSLQPVPLHLLGSLLILAGVLISVTAGRVQN